MNNIQSGYILYRKEMFVKLMIYIILITSLIIFSSCFYKVKTIQMFLLLLCVLPLVFIKAITRYYTRLIFIEISTNNLVSITTKKINGNIENSININLDDIRDYQITLPNRRFVVITFNMKYDKKIEFSFATSMNEAKGIEVFGIINRFRESINNYNKLLSDKKILLKPSFYASSGGMIAIFILSLLIIVAVILHIIYSVKTLPISLFLSIMILIQLINRRMTDLKNYNTMK